MEGFLGTRRGDLNLDGKVTFGDFLRLAANLGRENIGWADGDLNGDRQVTRDDFELLSANFGYAALRGTPTS